MRRANRYLTYLLLWLAISAAALEARAVSLCRSWSRATALSDQGRIILGLNSERPNGASLPEVFAMQVRQGQTARRFWQSHQPGDRVIGIELRNIKQLNEQVLGISQTEQFLEVFKIRLHERLANFYPERGIVFSNFKRIFVWFPASLEHFRADVLERVIAQVADDMGLVRTKGGQSFDWRTFLRENLRLSVGSDPLMSSIGLSLDNSSRIPLSARTNEQSFARFATEARRQLSAALQERGLTIGDLLDRARRTSAGGEAKALGEWLQSLRLERLQDLVLAYLDVLRVAEFLPFPDAAQVPGVLQEFVSYRRSEPFGRWRTNWNVERKVFKHNSANAEFIFVTDVQGLGKIGLRLLDLWVVRGAQFRELPMVFWPTTSALEQRIREVRQELVALLTTKGEKPEVQVYMSGDDAIWSISKLNEPQSRLATDYLNQLKTQSARFNASGIEFEIKYHVSPLVRIERVDSLFELAIENAINEARSILKLHE